MINFIKRNKTISILIILSLIAIILGIMFNAVIGEENKRIVAENIANLVEGNITPNTVTNHLLLTIFLWILGISLIGFVIILLLYLFNLFITSFELSALFINLGLKKIIKILLYSIPNIIYIFSLFILCLYSISYSMCLYRVLFKKKNYNLSLVTKKYLKIFIICLLITILSNILDIIIIKKLMLI